MQPREGLRTEARSTPKTVPTPCAVWFSYNPLRLPTSNDRAPQRPLPECVRTLIPRWLGLPAPRWINPPEPGEQSVPDSWYPLDDTAAVLLVWPSGWRYFHAHRITRSPVFHCKDSRESGRKNQFLLPDDWQTDKNRGSLGHKVPDDLTFTFYLRHCNKWSSPNIEH